MFQVIVDMFIGLDTPKLNVPSTFQPTWSGRTWVISPFVNPAWTIILAAFPALIGTILLFMDQQITAVVRFSKKNCYYFL